MDLSFIEQLLYTVLRGGRKHRKDGHAQRGYVACPGSHS
jgi:hypothetical protein